MPVLQNAKHERFAQALAKGKTATDAHVYAGYKLNDSNASKLARHPDVQARVTEIIGNAARRVEITKASLLAELEEARLGALADGQWSAAVAATRERGILSGIRVERSEHGVPGEFDAMSEEELDREAAELAARMPETLSDATH